ncbi:hypothetical protein D3C73_1605410 [compost metagenome]
MLGLLHGFTDPARDLIRNQLFNSRAKAVIGYKCRGLCSVLLARNAFHARAHRLVLFRHKPETALH